MLSGRNTACARCFSRGPVASLPECSWIPACAGMTGRSLSSSDEPGPPCVSGGGIPAGHAPLVIPAEAGIHRTAQSGHAQAGADPSGGPAHGFWFSTPRLDSRPRMSQAGGIPAGHAPLVIPAEAGIHRTAQSGHVQAGADPSGRASPRLLVLNTPPGFPPSNVPIGGRNDREPAPAWFQQGARPLQSQSHSSRMVSLESKLISSPIHRHFRPHSGFPPARE